MRATAASPQQSHSNAISKPHLWPTQTCLLTSIVVYIVYSIYGKMYMYVYIMKMPDPLTHWVRPGIKLASSWILVRLITAEPQQELLVYFLTSKFSLFALLRLLIYFNSFLSCFVLFVPLLLCFFVSFSCYLKKLFDVVYVFLIQFSI